MYIKIQNNSILLFHCISGQINAINAYIFLKHLPTTNYGGTNKNMNPDILLKIYFGFMTLTAFG